MVGLALQSKKESQLVSAKKRERQKLCKGEDRKRGRMTGKENGRQKEKVGKGETEGQRKGERGGEGREAG